MLFGGSPGWLVSLLLGCLLGCTREQSTPVQLLLARSATVDGHCVAPSGPSDVHLSASEVRSVRISVRTHAIRGDRGAFLCDRVFALGPDQPALKLQSADIAALDLYAEAFSDTPPQRIASGALLDVDPKDRLPSVLRLYRTRSFGCLPAALNRARAFHSATRLPDGDVLLVGGLVASGLDEAPTDTVSPGRIFATGAAEIYHPASSEFFVVEEPVPAPRAFHAAALLPAASDCGGDKVRIALIGGFTSIDGATPLFGVNTGQPGQRLVPFDTSSLLAAALPTRAAQSEVMCFDPATRTATRSPLHGVMPAGYQGSAPLQSGLAVAGGIDFADPLNAVVAEKPLSVVGADQLAGTIQTSRLGATLTSLDADRALLYGGGQSETEPLAELVSGLSGTSAPVSALLTIAAPGVTPTQFHTATGFGERVLVTGGFLSGSSALQPPAAPRALRILTISGTTATETALVPEGYSLDTTCTVSDRYRPAGWESAVALPNGAILVSGGTPASLPGGCNDCESGEASLLCSLHQASLFFPPGRFMRAPAPLGIARFGHSSTVLLDGTVLITGGFSQPDGGQPTRLVGDVELFNSRAAAPESSQPDLDDPAASDLASLHLQRAAGEEAVDPANPGVPARRCGEF